MGKCDRWSSLVHSRREATCFESRLRRRPFGELRKSVALPIHVTYSLAFNLNQIKQDQVDPDRAGPWMINDSYIASHPRGNECLGIRFPD